MADDDGKEWLDTIGRQINEPAKFSSTLEKTTLAIYDCTFKILELCNEMREALPQGAMDWTWYHYREDVRKIFDAISLVEHDNLLLTQATSRLAEKNWTAYYRAHKSEY